jgi:uncharacterized protein (DUF169 family)
MDHKARAHELSTKLGLDTAPIALAFVEAPPANIQFFEDEVPSSCTLWRRAEAGVFYAPAEKHFNCPVGAMVMGFELPDHVSQALRGCVEMMCGCGYITPDEPAKIPTLKQPKSGIVYGPFADFPLTPDLILMWLTPRQAMLYSEAVGQAQWTAPAPLTASGRPACAALPLAFENSDATLSLGCMGMRTYTEINPDRLLAVLPAKKLSDFLAHLEATLQANQTMHAYYAGQKAQFAA